MNSTTPSDAAAPEVSPNAGRRVLILGALSAIAVATARLYAAEGARLVLVARNQDRLDRVADDLRARGALEVEAITLDLVAEAASARKHLTDWAKLVGGLYHAHIF